jgi:uncharacterized protein (DUF58 family)
MRTFAGGAETLRRRFAPSRLLQHGLPPTTRLTLRVRWPLGLLGLAALLQILLPDPIWVTLIIAFAGLYAAGGVWARALARGLSVQRTRAGSILVAGDALDEEFRIVNAAPVPMLWAELVDESDLPGYNPGRVVATGASSAASWRAQAICATRGVYRLGPHRVATGDPLGLFAVEARDERSERLLIYPRIVDLPRFPLPPGVAGGDERRRRPLFGVQPGATVRAYQEQDSLKYVHWPSTAHRGELMVRELELEPSGDVWVVLDANAAAHSSVQATPGGETRDLSTLETAVTVAASLVARLVDGSQRRPVGLLATDGGREGDASVMVPPATGQPHLWHALAALAPLRASGVELAALLRSAQGFVSRRAAIVAVTADFGVDAERTAAWLAALAGLRVAGIRAHVVAVTTPASAPALDELAGLLARQGIGVTPVAAGARLPALLTHRRKRRVVRATPTGGAVTLEIEEEVA